ncbi:hypothetical protein C1881_06900 [Slackia isoflavoniconvertens]|uniref:Uncharacterized protein n=1 Tax=Slackia isoflavoniconvertens TaxID=572010 RepID=A0A369LID5_9ACTN|nr:hypothetical protein C1881_06900 [Slackia isoflavoniconvertens]
MCFLIEPKAYSASYVERCISYTVFTKGEFDSRWVQRQISDVFKNGLECGKNIAVHPLVETAWRLQALYPQVKMSIENQLEHEG